MTNCRWIRALVFAAVPVLFAASPTIQEILADRVDTGHKSAGIVAAIIRPDKREVTAYGRMSGDRPGLLNGDTIFEIGSVTKVFTALVFCDMLERKEIRLNTTVEEVLPGIRIPSRNGNKITLLDLATHVSGLPPMDPSFTPADLENPFADYDSPRLYRFLAGHTLMREVGEKYEYSNIGIGLLAHALARKAHMSIGELFRIRIFDPLGMTSTGFILSDEQKTRFAQGYDGALLATKPWDFDVLAGAGGLKSTPNDLLRFLAANLEFVDTPISKAIRRMRTLRRASDRPDVDSMAGWQVWKKFGSDLVWHDGVTGGYWAFLGFDPATRTGAAVLANTRYDIDDIGLHAIDPRWPLEKLPSPKPLVETAVDPRILERYTGTYRFGANYSVRVALQEGHLVVYDTREAGLILYPRSTNVFFFKAIDATVTFMNDASGEILKLVLRVNGEDSQAMKVQ